MSSTEPRPPDATDHDPLSSGTTAGRELTGSTFADRINHLFEVVRREDGSRYSNDEVAATVGKVPGGPQISGAYISALRRGTRNNPTKKHLEALAQFFTVRPSYFFDDTQFQVIAEELNLLRLLANAGVKRVATRLGGLSPDSLRNIGSIIERVREIEGLDTDENRPR